MSNDPRSNVTSSCGSDSFSFLESFSLLFNTLILRLYYVYYVMSCYLCSRRLYVGMMMLAFSGLGVSVCRLVFASTRMWPHTKNCHSWMSLKGLLVTYICDLLLLSLSFICITICVISGYSIHSTLSIGVFVLQHPYPLILD